MEAPTTPLVAVVQVSTQQPGVLHQLILHPNKVKDGMLIRLGDFPGDEYTGWQYLRNIAIVQVLGEAVSEEAEVNGKSGVVWKCVPKPEFQPIVAWPNGKPES